MCARHPLSATTNRAGGPAIWFPYRQPRCGQSDGSATRDRTTIDMYSYAGGPSESKS
jgi:hypothetical protein